MKVLQGRTGQVTLVGAGPGDPDLITVKGLRALQQADVVIYDRLVNPGLLEHVRESAEKLYVGKRGGRYTFPQNEINRLLVERAMKGAHVVRLKGGDPFLFGRGGEEALFLQQKGVPFEIIPGVSAALAAPAAAGIPLTHRGLSSSVAILSGHQAEEASNPINWAEMAGSADTLVVMMPLLNLRQTIGRLISQGRPLSTPAAVIQSGTCDSQRCVISTLRGIASDVEQAGLSSPATLVVGDVVGLAPAIQRAGNRSEVQREEPTAETIKVHCVNS